MVTIVVRYLTTPIVVIPEVEVEVTVEEETIKIIIIIKVVNIKEGKEIGRRVMFIIVMIHLVERVMMKLHLISIVRISIYITTNHH